MRPTTLVLTKVEGLVMILLAVVLLMAVLEQQVREIRVVAMADSVHLIIQQVAVAALAARVKLLQTQTLAVLAALELIHIHHGLVPQV